MNSPARNNYAAPNTPIASSKRSKIVKKGNEISSPTKLSYVTVSNNNNSADAPSTPKRDTFDANQYKTNMNMHLVSPSKNLFAPIGRPYQDQLETESNSSHYLSGFSSSSNTSSVGGGGVSTPVRSESSTPAVNFSAASPSYNRSNFSNSSSYESSEQDENRNAKVEEKKVEVQDDDDDGDVFNPYLFIARLPKHDDVRIPNKICLPPSTNKSKKTLVLDLDETLVHCTVEPTEHYDHKFSVEFNDTMYMVYVRKRPYLDHFLETVCKNFEVVLFTASQRVYADRLLELLDPTRRWINYRLFRESCLNVYGNYLKDLSVLGREMKKTILVDNSPYAYGYQTDNGVPIESWFDDNNDTELLKLATFLSKIECADDVRPFIREHFKTHELVLRASRGLPVPVEAPPF